MLSQFFNKNTTLILLTLFFAFIQAETPSGETPTLATSATFINSSQDSVERGKARSKRSGLNEESMAKAMPDEEDRAGEAAADQIPDEFMKVAATFIPPKGWQVAQTKELPPRVKIIVVGKSKENFPPSINLATEEFRGTLKDYLAIVKEINRAEKTEWKNLGMIRTQSGDANLSQVTMKNEWGTIKMMHAILVKDGVAYIMTASALQKEFGNFYREFFQSMRTLKITS